MHFAGILGALRRSIVTFTGTLGGTASTSTVTGGSGTAVVPSGSTGVVSVSQTAIGAGGTLEHNKASAGFVSTGGSITFTNGDSIVFRITGTGIGDGLIVQLNDGSIPSTAFTLQRT